MALFYQEMDLVLLKYGKKLNLFICLNNLIKIFNSYNFNKKGEGHHVLVKVEFGLFVMYCSAHHNIPTDSQ